MANYSNLKAAIAAAIKQNGNQEITGQVLQDVLTSMVSVIGANYTFAGVATPSTNPGTPDQNVVYLAMEGGTYTNFNGMVLPAGISLLMWNGTWTSETVMYGDGGVFDISVYKSSGGTLATFADLSAALDGGSNIPASARKGGMSIKYVQTSDNKYVQFRLMSDTFNTTVANWQGVDDEPTAGSNNLVKSGGVSYSIKELQDEIYESQKVFQELYNEIELCTTNQYMNKGVMFATKYTNSSSILVDRLEINIIENLENTTIKVFSMNSSYEVNKIFGEYVIPKGVTGNYKIRLTSELPSNSYIGILNVSNESVSKLKLKGYGNTAIGIGFLTASLISNLNVGDTIANVSNFNNYCYCIAIYEDCGDRIKISQTLTDNEDLVPSCSAVLASDNHLQSEIDDLYDSTRDIEEAYNEIDLCTTNQFINYGSMAATQFHKSSSIKVNYINIGVVEVLSDTNIKVFSMTSSYEVNKIFGEFTIKQGSAGNIKIRLNSELPANSFIAIVNSQAGSVNQLKLKGLGNSAIGVGMLNASFVTSLNVGDTISNVVKFDNYCYCIAVYEDCGEKKDYTYEPLANKTVVFMGDSFMDGGAGHNFDSNPNSVVKQIIANAKIGEWYNFALGGACFCCDANTKVKQTEVRSELYGDGPYPNASGCGGSNVIINQVNRLIALVNNGQLSTPDIIVIMAGTNDRVPIAANPGNLGSVESAFNNPDISHYTLPECHTTALGARVVAERIIDNFPNATMVISTPCYLRGDGGREINDVIKGVFEYMGVGCYEAWKECGVNVRYGTHYPEVFLHDGLHPNVLGAKKIANYLLGKMIELSKV